MKKPTTKEQIKILTYFQSIHKIAKFINENFHRKTLHYKSASYEFSLNITKNNLMHLCGIDYIGGSRAFFDDSLDNKLSIDKIGIKTDDTTLLKLEVLSELDNITTKNVLLCPSNTLGQVRYHFAIRTNKKILMVALNEVGNDGKYVPISLINLRTIKNNPKGERVLSITCEDHENKKLYDLI
ncbi:MAG: PBECR4 domain-containing protein [Acholeplasmataceae bacterium]|nr:PBECR4 domain-containing protein [Acholeplasmataceae bacterium]